MFYYLVVLILSSAKCLSLSEEFTFPTHCAAIKLTDFTFLSSAEFFMFTLYLFFSFIYINKQAKVLSHIYFILSPTQINQHELFGHTQVNSNWHLTRKIQICILSALRP